MREVRLKMKRALPHFLTQGYPSIKIGIDNMMTDHHSFCSHFLLVIFINKGVYNP